ncbi:MAG: cupin domain-containing protein [Bacteroidota bacterium]
MTAQDWVQKLDMKPHPEGGFYKETYRSVGSIPVEGLPATYGSERSYATGIYFLLDGENFSALHRLKQDEMWHFYAGSRLLVHLIDSTGNYNQIQLGPDVDAGEVFQAVVPGGSYFGSEVQDKSSFALVGCTVSPGFDFRDFEMPSAEELLAQYPEHESVIRRMTRH